MYKDRLIVKYGGIISATQTNEYVKLEKISKKDMHRKVQSNQKNKVL